MRGSAWWSDEERRHIFQPRYEHWLFINFDSDAEQVRDNVKERGEIADLWMSDGDVNKFPIYVSAKLTGEKWDQNIGLIGWLITANIAHLI